ncbi:hypothetical protein E4K10_45720 [Streptomyces sp. T1317-0309]|uniref:Uncharacterized protein n=1 Tax=Streptomyces lannensis TaxID=766498 RepID=A0ABP7LPW2_9ACTN|nr:hypothetical protein E4K10_45720 [Streptomyces sp. T1317-0309]
MLTCWDAALWETCWDTVARPCALLVGAGQGQGRGGVDLALYGGDPGAGERCVLRCRMLRAPSATRALRSHAAGS